ncbi:MAG: hypothetical protein JJE30_03475 [Desulfuromonadales bacterium]|nr:hypothetical protein [Desulfuromonadales bacterium]
MKDVIYRKLSPFADFCIHHQRSIPVAVLSGILISTWYIFYGTVGQRGRRLLYCILAALSAITIYGVWEVNNEYQELQGYIIHAVLPLFVAVAIGTIKLKFDITNALARPFLTVIFFLSATYFSYVTLGWLTPVFALVNWG